MPSRERQSFPDVEPYHLASALSRRFIQRWDLHARQLDNGRYICVHKPLTIDRLHSHLRGEITLGTYVLNLRDEARFIVMDADDDRGFFALKELAGLVAAEKVPVSLERSRRGGHMWMFFARFVPGHMARDFGHRLVISVHYNLPNPARIFLRAIDCYFDVLEHDLVYQLIKK